MRDYPHLSARLFGQPQLIWAAKLEQWLPNIGAQLLGAGGAPAPRAGWDDDDDDAPRRPRKPYQMTADGIAVIDVFGTLVNRGVGLDAWSGMTSYEHLRSELRAALSDGDVRAILLDVESFGGEGAGCFNLARELAAARAAKPVHAIVDAACCSAAYALACGALRLTMVRGGLAGSIGVISIHAEQSRFNEKQGFTWTYVAAGARKADFADHQKLPPEGLAFMRAAVEDTYQIFVAHVAATRPLTAESIRATEAGVYRDADALRLGLIDAIGTRDDAFAALRAALSEFGRPRSIGSTVAAPGMGPAPAASLTIPGAGALAQTSMETPEMTTQTTAAGAPAAPQTAAPTPVPAAAPAAIAQPAPAGQQPAPTPAAAPANGGGNVVALDAARGEGEAAGLAFAQEVMDLCMLAREPGRARDFIAAKTPLADVQKTLVNEAAARGDAVINGQHAPHGANAAANHGWEDAFTKVSGHLTRKGA